MSTIDPLPAAPSRSDTPANFISKANAWIAALVAFVTQTNTVAGEVNTNATNAAASAAAAAGSAAGAAGSATASAASAAASAASAGAAMWSNVTNYVIGNRAISGVNYQPYTRKTNGSGGADPSANSADWQPIFTPGFNGQVKTANYNAVAGDQYMHDTTGGAFTATLPGAPNMGDPPIPFHDQKGTFAVNNLTLDPGANKFRGVVQTVDLDINNFSGQVCWTGATWGWDFL